MIYNEKTVAAFSDRKWGRQLQSNSQYEVGKTPFDLFIIKLRKLGGKRRAERRKSQTDGRDCAV